MTALITLADLAIGSQGVVRELPRQGAAFLRLREMGVLPGTVCTLLRRAPLGDPLEIKVRGYHLTLRQSEATQILVECPAGLKPAGGASSQPA